MPDEIPNYLTLAQVAAQAGDIPLTLALACGQAESGFDTTAQRWGRRTPEALELIAAQDWDGLQLLIDSVWPDISFGVAQKVVLYHWCGDRQPSVTNCLYVRQRVWDDPTEDCRQMGLQLGYCYQAALDEHTELGPVDGDAELMALICYNAGHIPWPGASYWTNYSVNVEGYRWALRWAREQV